MFKKITVAETLRDIKSAVEHGELNSRGGRRRLNEAQRQHMARIFEIVNAAGSNDVVARLMLKEILSTSDFSDYFGHGIDAMLLDAYQGAKSDWRKYIHVGDTFSSLYRSVEGHRITHGTGLLLETAEGESIKYDNPTGLTYSFKPKVFTRARRVTMHALMSDDLGGIKRTPTDLLDFAMTTEEWYSASLWAANTTLYKDDTTGGRPAASGSQPAGNRLHLALTADNLSIAYTQFSRFFNEQSIPIKNRPIYLVVCPALYTTAVQINNSTEVRPTGATDSLNNPTGNPMYNMFQVIENPWIPYHDTTYGNKSWYLFSDPNVIWGVDMRFYQGMERPFVFKELPQRQTVSGGALMGDFETGGTAWGCQHIMGGSHTNAVGGWRATLWSDATP